MSALAEQIAEDHWLNVITEQCHCRGYGPHQDYGLHLAQIIEAAVRAQIAAEIESYNAAYNHGENNKHITACIWEVATWCARVARGQGA